MKKGTLFPVASNTSVLVRFNHLRVEATGEFRNPRKGEWYISGAIPEGYDARNDLSTPYHIARLVRVEVEVKKIETVVEVIK